MEFGVFRDLSVYFGATRTVQLHGGEQDAAACQGLYGRLAAVSIAWKADALQFFCFTR